MLVPIPVANIPGKKFRLGAEELIELGQASVPAAPVVSPSSARQVVISKEEGLLIVKTVENIVAFAQNYPIEFHAYCPTDRWQGALTQVGTWTHEIERQLQAGAQQVSIPAEVVFRLLDLEKCVSASREARISSARLAFTISAFGALSNVLLGWTWVSVPVYLAGLAVLFGQPLAARLTAEPEDPYKPVLSGRKTRHCLGGECELIAMKLIEQEKNDPNVRKVLERVVACPDIPVERHYWGTIKAKPGGNEKAVCLSKGRFRVRVEGWEGDVITPDNGWVIAEDGDCWGNIVIAVWSPDRDTRETKWGEVSQESDHEKTYWVEYVGPLTGGKLRRAGPFGCTGDPAEHAMEDGGFKTPGEDGDYVIFDAEGNPVEGESHE